MKHTPKSPSSAHGIVPLSGGVARNTKTNASYLIQSAAHLYFIFSGLWLTARWLGRKLPVIAASDVMTERAGLQQRFSRYLEMLRDWKLFEVEFVGFEDCDQWERTIIAPNHPSIFDAVMLVSRITGLDCVMNSKLLKDPVMGGAARLCGYVCNNAPIQMIKTCENRLAAGANILIFPEGTRTTSPPLGKLHHGYAFAAIRASAAIRTVFIECDSLYFGRSFSFFRPTKCPLHYRLTASKVFHPSKNDDPREVSHEIEKYYRDALEAHGEGIRLKQS